MSNHTDFEELEQIPWSALATATNDARNRYLSLAAGVLFVVAVVGWLVWRGGGSSADGAVALPETTAAATTLTAAPVTAAPTETTVYSEADLMLIDGTDEQQLAAMHAEWLVRDLMTIDEDPLVGERIGTLLPDVERGSTGTYVEWATPIAITSPEPGRYRVDVAFRTLTAGEGGFVRQPVSALAVDLTIDVDGTARLVSVPEVVAVPVIHGLGS